MCHQFDSIRSTEEQSRQAMGPVVVGLGASAGGLEPLEQFLSHVPEASGMAFVVAQHREPHSPSLLTELLARHTTMPVVEACDGTRPEPNCVYAVAPGTSLTIEKGAFRVTAGQTQGARTVIDRLFCSLADYQGEHAIGIILSGAGHDGTVGLRSIKERGGMTLAQCPETAKHDSMPASAIEAGLIDHVLPAAAMPAKLVEHGTYVTNAKSEHLARIDAQLETSLDTICAALRRHTGNDFALYKQGTLLRRIRRRMQVQHIDTVDEYLELLETAEGEPAVLLKDLLIGVTQFFRDTEAFQALAQQVVPRVIQSSAPDAPIRIWVAGCASGEEVYSIAILIREHLGRLGTGRVVQIFATDLDAEMLAEARRGRYGKPISEQVSAERLARFFVRDGQGYEAAQELREMCIFSEHSLIRDPPFSQLDLISCRNVLIYLNSDLQKRLFPLFHYALRPSGFLFLGSSEGIAGNPELFETLDKNYRIFRRRETVSRPNVEFPLAGRSWLRVSERSPVAPVVRESPAPKDEIGAAFERLLRDEYTLPAAVINERGEALFIAGPISRYLQLPAGPVAAPNLFEAFRGRLRHELHAALRSAKTLGRKVVRDNVRVEVDDATRIARLIVRPMPAIQSEAALYLVVVQELAASEASSGLQAEERDGEPPVVEYLEGELRATRIELKTVVEELESANEELKSSNEELISTNEELQSANEELQTSKEELQSLNEELETVNAELRSKLDELGAANSDLQNLFSATKIATIFLDGSLRVAKFTPAATALFHLIQSDVGRPLADLAPRFAGQDLLSDAQLVLQLLTPIERQVHTAEGAWFSLRVLPYRTIENVVQGVLITFVDISEIKRAEAFVRQQAELLHLSHDAIFVRRLDGVIETWNRGAQELYGYSAAEAIGQSAMGLLGTEFSIPREQIDAELAHGGCWVGELQQRRKDGRAVTVISNKQLVHGEDGVDRVLEANRDITERKAAERRLAYLASFPEHNPNPVVEADAEGHVRYANPSAEKLFPTLSAEQLAHPWLADWAMIAHQLRNVPRGKSIARDTVIGERTFHQEVYFSPEQGLIRTYGLDITERKRAEESLRISEEQNRFLAHVVRSISQPFGVGYPDGSLGLVNAAFEKLTGYTKEELNSIDWGKTLTPQEWVQLEQEKLEELHRTLQPVRYEKEYIRKDGTRVPVELLVQLETDSDGKPHHYISFIADITERKRAEMEREELLAQLTQEKQRVDAILEGMRDAFFTLDRDFRITGVNRQQEKISQLKREQTLGRIFWEVWPESAKPETKYWIEYHRVAETRVPSAFLDYYAPLDVWTDVSVYPDSAGGIAVFFRDVSEIMRTQEALRLSEERFRTLASNAQDSITRFDRVGRYVYVNPTVCRQLGLPEESIIGKTAEELGRNVGVDNWEARLREVVESGQPQRVDHKTVEGRYWDAQLMPEFNGDEVETVLAIGRDITDRKKAELALLESEAALRGILDAATESIWLFSVDGVALLGNRTALERWGKSADTVIGKSVHEFLSDDMARSRLERIQEAARTGCPVQLEDSRAGIRFEHRFYPVLGADGHIDRVVAFSRDITERQRAADVLRRYELLASYSRDIVLFMRRDDGRILEANAAALSSYGYSRDEMLLLSISELRGLDTAPLTEQQMAIADERGILFETIHRCKDGSTFPVEVSSRGATIDGTRMLISIVRDITERKRSEEALRESETFLSFALTTARTGAWDLNLVDHIARRSLQHDQIFGYDEPLPEWTYEMFLEHIIPEDRELVDQKFRQAMETLSDWNFECRILRRDGQMRWIWAVGRHRLDARGQPQRQASGIIQDITDRKAAEQALRGAKQQLDSLLENSPLAVVEWTCPDYRIVRWSDEAERVFGWAAVEVVGRRINEIPWVYEEDWPLVEQVMADMLSGHCPRNVNKNRNRRKDGSVIHCEWYNSTVTDASGNLAAVLSLVLDVTELKRAEEALREANQQLAEADRNKNEFLALLSHELRNPLTPIRNSLYLLDHVLPGSEQANHAKAVIARQASQLSRLVDDLLDVTRVSRNKIQLRCCLLDLNKVVRCTVEDHRSLFERNEITLETELTTEPLSISGDEARLAQVIGNLLQNAAKFTAKGGRVTVCTALIASKKLARLSVNDTGAGFEPALLGRLFQPFMQADTTLDRSAGGLGLGLALVKGVIELHGGQVYALSEGPGHGALFVVELPLDEHAISVSEPASADTHGAVRRVLIIEDNVDAADSLRDALEFCEHIVAVAYNGPDGLAKARDFRPEVVLCDIGLPGMDGFEVAKAFRTDMTQSGVVLIALSGYALPEDQTRAIQAGFHYHLAKPPSLNQLEHLLEQLPEYSRAPVF